MTINIIDIHGNDGYILKINLLNLFGDTIVIHGLFYSLIFISLQYDSDLDLIPTHLNK